MTGRFGDRRFGGGAAFGAGAGGHLGDTLSALLDGELYPPQADAARAHLNRCPDCTAELSAVGQARSWVRGLPAVDPPFGFYERILLDRAPLAVAVAAGAPVAGGNLRRRAGLVAVGVAAAAVTVLGVGSPQQSPTVPSVPHFVAAHAASASVSVDLVSKLTPLGLPVSSGR
jgi:anti-sigma factor RsiW